MNAVAHTQTAQVAESNTVSMFERLARDPSVSVEKLERLMDLQDRANKRDAEAAFNADLAAMQAELPTVKERGGIKDRSGNVQSKYALWEDVNAAILPVMKVYGFSLTFRQEQTDKGICVTGVLSHRMGHSERTSITLPADTSGSKNAVQAVGSSVSYGKRYTAGMLLNLNSADIEGDDDGRHAGSDLITEEQAMTIESLIDDAKADKAKFLAWIKADTVEHIPARFYAQAVAMLNKKRKEAGK